MGEIRDAIEGCRAGEQLLIENVPYVVVPEGYRIERFEDALPNPKRKAGHFVMLDEPSFIDYVNRHKSALSTMTYFEPTALNVDRRARFVCVFDDHEEAGGEAGWRGHSVAYELRLSRHLLAWQSMSGGKEQAVVAEFLRDRISEIANPDGASLFEMIKKLQVSQSSSFSKAIRLDNGDVRLTYTSDSTAGFGELTLPEELTLVIPVYENSDPSPVRARLSYRLREGALTLAIAIVDLAALLEARQSDAVQRVQSTTGIRVMYGLSGIK